MPSINPLIYLPLVLFECLIMAFFVISSVHILYNAWPVIIHPFTTVAIIFLYFNLRYSKKICNFEVFYTGFGGQLISAIILFIGFGGHEVL